MNKYHLIQKVFFITFVFSFSLNCNKIVVYPVNIFRFLYISFYGFSFNWFNIIMPLAAIKTFIIIKYFHTL